MTSQSEKELMRAIGQRWLESSKLTAGTLTFASFEEKIALPLLQSPLYDIDNSMNDAFGMLRELIDSECVVRLILVGQGARYALTGTGVREMQITLNKSLGKEK